MATPEQVQALLKFRDAAIASGHIWPEYAACEAALESSWGTSQLALEANNVFGEKQFDEGGPFPTIELPTREFMGDQWITEIARWVKFPALDDAFRERMTKLRDLSHFYKEYAAALTAKTGEDFITQVSRRWSTDPQRAEKVLEIYNAHRDVLSASAH